ncbi:hypothetical protein ACHAWF_010646 [Thalassiosira exigua]
MRRETYGGKFIGSILTRLPFGSSPAPAKFSICSETIFDLAKDLLHCPHWDPSTLPSPYNAEIPPPERPQRTYRLDVHNPSTFISPCHNTLEQNDILTMAPSSSSA